MKCRDYNQTQTTGIREIFGSYFNDALIFVFVYVGMVPQMLLKRYAYVYVIIYQIIS